MGYPRRQQYLKVRTQPSRFASEPDPVHPTRHYDIREIAQAFKDLHGDLQDVRLVFDDQYGPERRPRLRRSFSQSYVPVLSARDAAA